MTRALERMPLYFIENRGQLDSRVAYYVQGRDTTLYFTAEGMTLVKTDQRHERDDSEYGLEKVSLRRGLPQTPDPVSRWIVKLDFVGANPNPKIEAAEPTPAVISYFNGPKENWKAGLSTYGSIVYSDLWPGIDLVYSGTADRLKYTFLVKPGADPSQVQLAYRGARDVRLNEAGQLEVETPAGVLQDDRPYAYQEVEGRRVEIGAGYSLGRASANGSRHYGFAFGSYDHSKPLVLDPAMFVYCGYIGGGGSEGGTAIAVDSSGSAYVSGYTNSTETTFPVTVGPDLTNNGGFDTFVAKVNAAGSALVYCGYIGGTGSDVAFGIAVDSSGNAYVTGDTGSSEATFPVIAGPSLAFKGVTDAFVAKVNAAGTALVYCGYIGGSGLDHATAIATDSSGNAYVSGYTRSTEATFPVTVGPNLTFNGGLQDAFVAKVNAAGTALDYCGYIGGSGDDQGSGIAVDSAGNAYVTGTTSSTEATFPVILGPNLTFNGGLQDAFVAKVNAAGTALDYCGYIGGADTDVGHGIAVDSSGNAYVTGQTYSSEATFPVTVGPDLTWNGNEDVFVAKVNAAGTALAYCGYIGGTENDFASGIAVDSAGNAYVAGATYSTELSFPVTVGPDLTFKNGDGATGSNTNAFAAKVNAAGTALAYCGYIGGSENDVAAGIAVDSSGNAYVTGNTSSTEATFPVSIGPDPTYNGGGSDAFVAKICVSPAAPSASNNGPICVGETLQLTASAVAGASYAWTGPNGFTSALQNPSIPNATAAAIGTYTVTATVAVCTSAPGTTNVLALTAPAVTAPSTVGAGSPNRTASVPLHAGSTYTWTIGNGTITSGDETSQITFTAGTAGTPLTLSVTETNVSGCVSAPGDATVAVLPAGSAALFYTLRPCRVLDTRTQTGPLGAPPLQPGATRTFDVAASSCGVPAGAVAISVNLTVTNVAAPGELVLFRSDILRPNASAITFRAGRTRANNAVVSLSSSGTTFSVFNNSPATVDFILDVNGFFQ